ncbi:MAG TPA: hypothetical protein VGS58_21450, partial [Candidatus Sulfopaludibacter sp.]|nr:hypothetical protein [Candidatus Sulfopaludibacter sp.]
EVADSANNGFTLKTTVQIQAPPDTVYQRLIQVGDWWDSAHTFSGNAKNLSIEEKPAGCFCEKLPNGGGVRHLEGVFLAPGQRLVLSGGLGPLQAIGATGAMSIDLAPAEGGTKLQVTYAVTGYLAAGMNTWAAPVDSVLAEQFTRLKNLVEQGDPAPKAK